MSASSSSACTLLVQSSSAPRNPDFVREIENEVNDGECLIIMIGGLNYESNGEERHVMVMLLPNQQISNTKSLIAKIKCDEQFLENLEEQVDHHLPDNRGEYIEYRGIRHNDKYAAGWFRDGAYYIGVSTTHMQRYQALQTWNQYPRVIACKAPLISIFKTSHYCDEHICQIEYDLNKWLAILARTLADDPVCHFVCLNAGYNPSIDLAKLFVDQSIGCNCASGLIKVLHGEPDINKYRVRDSSLSYHGDDYRFMLLTTDYQIHRLLAAAVIDYISSVIGESIAVAEPAVISPLK